MKFPLTITMRKAHSKTFRAEVPDRAAMTGLAATIMKYWKKGYSFRVIPAA